MLRFQKICLFVSFSLLLPLSLQAQVFSGFDTDDEGWTAVGDSTSGTASYSATGGNPGGYIFAKDSVAGGTWYWSAPDKFLGNKSWAIGGTLSFDLAQNLTNSQFNNSDIILSGGGLSLYFDTSYNPGSDFTSYSIDLDNTAGWALGTLTGAVPSITQFETVFADLTSIRIRGEYRSGSDTGSLDNVLLDNLGIIPEANTLPFMLGLISLCMLRRRRL